MTLVSRKADQVGGFRFIYYIHVCVDIHTDGCAMVHVWRPEDSLQMISFQHVSSRIQTQVVTLGSKNLYHLASPR